MTPTILIITPYVPYPLNSGGNQAFFMMVNHLRNDFTISLALSITPKESHKIESLKELWPNVTFCVHIKKKKSLFNRIRGGGKGFWHWINESSKRKIDRITKKTDPQRANSTLYNSQFIPFSEDFCHFIYGVSRKGFDIIQVEFYEYLSLIHLLPTDTKNVFIHHELRYIRNENELHLFNHPSISDNLLLKVARGYEISMLSHYNYIFTLTDVDGAKLKDEINSSTQIKVSPAAIVREPKEVAVEFKPNHTNRLVFLGSEGHYPNFDAVVWFCNEIAPLLRAKSFNFTFEVIGGWKTKHLAKEIGHSPELRLLGYVEDLDKCMEGSVMVVPIRIGSGMRIKILDAIASFIPFITTTKGTEGIDMRHQKECLIVDTPEQYAEAIIALCGDVTLQKQLAMNAFNRLQQIYVPHEMVEKRKSFYHEIYQA
ncbi:MAG: glycosyltransferase [Phocaeicola sp.]